jgi:hypothetical protein
MTNVERKTVIDVSIDEIRAVTGFAANCARQVLMIFEAGVPGDTRPRTAIEAAEAFADGDPRTALLRERAWAALRASRLALSADQLPAAEAARAASAAAAAAFLHPITRPTQVKHILGAAAHGILAMELAVGGGLVPNQASRTAMLTFSSPIVRGVLLRYPPAPAGGGRVGELVRSLDGILRQN